MSETASEQAGVAGGLVVRAVLRTDVGLVRAENQDFGTYTTPGGQSHAFRYTPGSGLLDLGTLGGTSSAPTGLNGRGEVIGTSTLADGSTHAFLWTPADGMEDITALTGLVDVRRLNDNMQTLTVTAPPTGTPGIGKEIPRLVQLQVTQSNFPPTAGSPYPRARGERLRSKWANP